MNEAPAGQSAGAFALRCDPAHSPVFRVERIPFLEGQPVTVNNCP
jgi:hypothetical protein